MNVFETINRAALSVFTQSVVSPLGSDIQAIANDLTPIIAQLAARFSSRAETDNSVEE